MPNKIALIVSAHIKSGIGEVTFAVGKIRYVYEVDTHLLEEIQRTSEHQPGKAFNMAKKHGTFVKSYTLRLPKHHVINIEDGLKTGSSS